MMELSGNSFKAKGARTARKKEQTTALQKVVVEAYQDI